MAGSRGANHRYRSRYGTIRLVRHLHRCLGSPPSRHQQRRSRGREAARHPRCQFQYHLGDSEPIDLGSRRRPVLPVRRLRRQNDAQRNLDRLADTYSFRHGFAGGKADSVTGRVHFRNRDYDTYLARWISRDPIGYEGSPFNLYEYVESNPLRYTDPTGNIPLAVAGCGLGAAGATVGSVLSNAGNFIRNPGTTLCNIGCDAFGGCVTGAITGQFPSIVGGCIGGVVGSLAASLCSSTLCSCEPFNGTCAIINAMVSGIMGCLGGAAAGADGEDTLGIVLFVLGVNSSTYGSFCGSEF